MTEKTPLDLERDSFIKMSLTALVANFWAHNREICFDEIIDRAIILTHKMWEIILEDRHERENNQ